MNKKIIAFMTAAAAMFSSVSAVQISADSSSQTETLISYGRSLIGSPDYNNYCQRFVRLCYESAGLYASQGANSAMDAYNYWVVSDSRDNIPIGACLYFNTSEYGHVAVYTGNNQMVHGVKIVREEQISDYYWDRFLGWGYQGGTAPEGIIYENENDTVYPSVPYAYTDSENGGADISWYSEGENTSHYDLSVYNTDTGENVFSETFSADTYSAYVNLSEGNYCSVVKAVNDNYSDSMSYSNYCTFTVEAAEEQLAGDVNHNGTVDIADLAMIGQYLSYNIEFDEDTFYIADVNYDGEVNILDFMTLKQYLVKL